MCGIVGVAAKRDVGQLLLDGLQRLAYRGYDSAGIALLQSDERVLRLRTEGKVHCLQQMLDQNPLHGHVGIGHTRWATHGRPSERNAHPHMSGDAVALVHNGIIENFQSLRQKVTELGFSMSSETDSEVIAHLFHHYYEQSYDLYQASMRTAAELKGAFALAIVHRLVPDRIIAIRHGSPLVIGLGSDENYLASDSLALLPLTKRFIYLEEGDMAEVTHDNVVIMDAAGKQVERPVKVTQQHYMMIDKGNYRHYMEKEIFEQPDAISATLEGRLGTEGVMEDCFGEQARQVFSQVERIQIVACGTSYHAGMVSRYWFESLAGIPCRVDIASEYRYHTPIVESGTLFVTLSQSGETADTLAALSLAKGLPYLASLCICNAPESSLVRESDLNLLTHAGPEIGVASTKAFTTQLVALLMLLTCVARYHESRAKITAETLAALMRALPRTIEQVLGLDETIKTLALSFVERQHALFLGRGIQYPVAKEGALKLKEISYIHAEAYPAGELKHGPLALVDKDMPVIAVAPNDELLEKLKSNLQEVHARGGKLYVFADEHTGLSNEENLQIITVPSVPSLLAPIVYTIPLQLLAYHVAVLKGTDVDQPRNLAKSVTVE